MRTGGDREDNNWALIFYNYVCFKQYEGCVRKLRKGEYSDVNTHSFTLRKGRYFSTIKDLRERDLKNKCLLGTRTMISYRKASS